MATCFVKGSLQQHVHPQPYPPVNPYVQAAPQLQPQPPQQGHQPPQQGHQPPQQGHQPQPQPQQHGHQPLLPQDPIHQPQSIPRPQGLRPAKPVRASELSSGQTLAGKSEHILSQSNLLGERVERRVEETLVQCLKTHMLVTFRFSAPFSGYIYPYQHFSQCMLFRGQNSRETSLQLKHGTCGDLENRIVHQGRSYLDPIIEHRLMVQWEPDIVCEDDSSVIVRCDRPDDYNKTVEWNLETQSLRATLERSTHPGPKMWMEIQRGEGPTAPPLAEELVYIGDVLTLVFTLSDDVYWFDSNILACYAVDGGEDIKQIEWDSSEHKQIDARSRVYSGETTVIEEGCSVKPKIFSHFLKEKHTRPNGDLVTLHYAHFKAFRFPTSLKIIIQCNVQVCYKECPEPLPCSVAFHPRRFEEQKQRRRREAAAAAEDGAHEVDKVQLHRSIDVFMAEEGGEKKINVNSPSVAQPLQDFCYSPTVYYATVIGLVSVIVILLIVLCFSCLRERFHKSSFFTPTKHQK
ncbi:putative Zona pellucida-like domain-containing protein 4 [Homarus americanus]|uniref:Putative Zona pellucida-like domain-containing protein 4 n=1 Tax=Homarus americanus TaxID=6706 RepID=A0A8J5N833_HOMAM|nr:putative Zona pellucida-like domain-containing protein 4 [Homarus americanus]